MKPIELTGRQIAALRLQTLGVLPTGATGTEPVDVARNLLAMQAQDFTASRWALGCRMPGCGEVDVIAAFDDGRLVRSWPMRGTVHVTPAEDLPWLLALTGVRALSPASLRRRANVLGLSEQMLERARDVAVQLLSGGGRATRGEFAEALTHAGVDVTGQTMYHVVWYLSQTGTLVHGPVSGANHQLVLLEEWIEHPRRLDGDAALVELVVRYLRAHGPATIEDLMWWSGLPKGRLAKGLDGAAEQLMPAVHAERGSPLLLLAETLERFAPDPASVARRTFMLAPFDEHLLGYTLRDDVIAPIHARAVDPSRNGVFRATIVHGGRVVGTWRAIRRARGVAVTLHPLTTLTAAQVRGAERHLAAWAAFRGHELLDVAVVPAPK